MLSNPNGSDIPEILENATEVDLPDLDKEKLMDSSVEIMASWAMSTIPEKRAPLSSSSFSTFFRNTLKRSAYSSAEFSS